MMSELLAAPLTAMFYTLILWWFITGLIMAVFKQSRKTVRIWYVCATLVMLGAMVGLAWTARSSSTAAVYATVTCGTLVWGWHVASYYLGFITGMVPQQSSIVADVSPEHDDQTVVYRTVLYEPARNTANVDSWLSYLFPQRFQRALLASLHHELLIVCFVVLIAVMTLPHPNRWGLWIFLTLWLMHTSAKLNIFLGVRNFRIDFLPQHLHFLEQFVAKRSSNLFFPISICVAVSVGLFLLYQVINPAVPATHSTGAALIGTMIALGILEHWMLVLPIPVALWGWSLRSLSEQAVES